MFLFRYVKSPCNCFVKRRHYNVYFCNNNNSNNLLLLQNLEWLDILVLF